MMKMMQPRTECIMAGAVAYLSYWQDMGQLIPFVKTLSRDQQSLARAAMAGMAIDAVYKLTTQNEDDIVPEKWMTTNNLIVSAAHGLVGGYAMQMSGFDTTQ